MRRAAAILGQHHNSDGRPSFKIKRTVLGNSNVAGLNVHLEVSVGATVRDLAVEAGVSVLCEHVADRRAGRRIFRKGVKAAECGKDWGVVVGVLHHDSHGHGGASVVIAGGDHLKCVVLDYFEVEALENLHRARASVDSEHVRWDDEGIADLALKRCRRNLADNAVCHACRKKILQDVDSVSTWAGKLRSSDQLNSHLQHKLRATRPLPSFESGDVDRKNGDLGTCQRGIHWLFQEEVARGWVNFDPRVRK